MTEPAPTPQDSAKPRGDEQQRMDDTTATVSMGDGDGDGGIHDEGFELGGTSSLPLLQYSQLAGLPRVSERTVNEDAEGNIGMLASPLTCSALGQVLLQPNPSSNNTAEMSSSSSLPGDPGASNPSHQSASSSHPGSTTATSTAPSGVASEALQDEDEEGLDDPSSLLSSDLWKQPHYVLAVGWENGQVSLQAVQNQHGLPVALEAGGALGGGDGAGGHATSTVADPTTASLPVTTRLAIREGTWNNPPPTVDVSWDSSGTLLGAIDQGGNCCIWEFKYKASWQPSNLGDVNPSSFQANPAGNSASNASTASSSTGNPTNNNNMFSSFMSALTGMPSSPEEEARRRAANSATSATDAPVALVPALAATVINISRITYPSSWQAPTCMVLDPAHKKGKGSRALLVGFADGRLILTKRGGGLFQRRNDTVLYHGTNSNTTSSTGGSTNSANENSFSSSSAYYGIECIAWRGNLVAWADAGGMKLLDVDTLTRIAHIDRPTGARLSLYPTLTGLRPHLAFETSQKLLVAWGDCLMSMDIREEAAMGEGSSVAIQRKVECTMAWELDCVASGVVPLDADHILVFGVVVPDTSNDQDSPSAGVASPAAKSQAQGGEEPAAILDLTSEFHSNELEIQVVSRADGTVHYADILPLDGPISSASHYQWFSTYQLPRMDNASEWQQYKTWSGEAGGSFVEDLDLTLLAAAGMAPGGQAGGSPTANRRRNPSFIDSHLKWNLQSLVWKEEEDDQDYIDDDASSIDSDDYGFVFRPVQLHEDVFANNDKEKPPAMILASPNELLRVTLSDVDDAIDHALIAQNRPALALKRGLQHRRQLRRYKVSDLVQHYLAAVLLIEKPEDVANQRPPQALSLRRMKLAIEAMPVLLGGHSHEWTKWAKTLEELPGALFLLRKQLPVRDPILPSSLYEQVLKGILIQVEHISMEKGVSGVDNRPTLDQEAADHFLDSLLAWGPTKVLKEYIKLFQYSRRKGDRSVIPALKKVETSLQRRYLQTSAGYLHFPAASTTRIGYRGPSNTSYDASRDDSQDSLFDWRGLHKWIQPRAPVVATDTGESDTAKVSSSLLNDQVYLEAIARLQMMQGNYDLSLKAYLYIAIVHSGTSLASLEESALAMVNGTKASDPPIRINGRGYEFVMGLIENHHLHPRLLDTEYLQGSKESKKRKEVPLLALIRLVGITTVGDFLMEHCTAPEWNPSSAKYESDVSRSQRETLPMDLIASQLASSPPLLHWYLHLVFERKPEFYIKFPNNALPPKIVTELHRRHLQLYLDFAGDARDSAKALAGTEKYEVEAKTTPLLRFLKEALPVGGISPIDVRRQLETIRSEELSSTVDADTPEGVQVSRSFALELAFVIEHYSDKNKVESLGILELYLEGTESVMLGVAYAQRQRKYSSVLWDKLITHCLTSSRRTLEDKTSRDGMLFGSLLEAAALSGADLARLVARIPPGMIVEGLRPRLVAAVADYRLKLGIHKAAATAATDEKAALLRQVAHRSRRGARYSIPKVPQSGFTPRVLASDLKVGQPLVSEILPKKLRTRERHEHHKLSFRIPMR